MIFAHPTCDEWNNREPEQQMQFRPQNFSVHALRRLEHVVMIVPVDRKIDEAQN
jgi:hypothetical protein